MVLVILIVSISGSMNVNPLDSVKLIVGNPISLIQSPTGGGVSAPTVPYHSPPYRGQLDIEIQHRDSLDLTEDRTEGEDLLTTFYKRLDDGRYVTMGSGDFSAVHINTDNLLYFTVQPLRGSDLYVSPMRMADNNLNPRIIDFDYVDVTQDGISEWIFAVDISGLPIPISGMGAPRITLFTLSYDEGNMFLNSPSDFEVYPNNSINNIRWELDVPPEQAVAINRVQLIFDTTDTSLINEKNSWIKVPYIDNLELQEMDKIMLVDKIIYRFQLGNTLGFANYLSTDSNADPSHDMTARIHTFLEEGDELGITLEISAITPDESFYTVSDKVNLISTSEKIPSEQEILDLAQEMTLEQLEEINWILNNTEK